MSQNRRNNGMDYDVLALKIMIREGTKDFSGLYSAWRDTIVNEWEGSHRRATLEYFLDTYLEAMKQISIELEVMIADNFKSGVVPCDCEAKKA